MYKPFRIMNLAVLSILWGLSGAEIRAQAVSVNVNGIVTDSAGVPISEAAVLLTPSGLKTTTGADGRFTVGTGSSGLRVQTGQVETMRIREGWLYLSLPERSRISVTAYDLDGKALARQVQEFSAGSRMLKLPEPGQGYNQGLSFFKIKVGNRETLAKVVSMSSGLQSAVFNLVAAREASPLAKSSRTAAAFFDVISVSKTGYLPAYLSLTTSDSSNIKIVMQKTGAPKFSFFVTSLKTMLALSGNAKGFGGDLRFGQTGAGAGLRGADKICATTAEQSMPGSYNKGWRAFLSVTAGVDGKQVDAIDRVGPGPWYDRTGRLLAPTKADLLAARPKNGDAAIQNDLPNEFGVPNSTPDPSKPEVDNHHFLTGSGTAGKLYPISSSNVSTTCMDWTSVEKSSGRPRIGFSFVAGNRTNWMSGQDEGGCGAGINLAETGGSDPSNPIVGSGGGYGGIYCFALSP